MTDEMAAAVACVLVSVVVYVLAFSKSNTVPFTVTSSVASVMVSADASRLVSVVHVLAFAVSNTVASTMACTVVSALTSAVMSNIAYVVVLAVSECLLLWLVWQLLWWPPSQ